MRILLPGAGGLPRHIQAFQAQPDVEAVVISDVHPWAYGNFVADAAWRLPPFEDPDFLDALLRLRQREPFDVVIPVHDASLRLFAERRDELERASLRVALDPRETIDVVADKLATHELFRESGLPTAELCTFARFHAERPFPLPAFLKPRFIEMRGSARQLYLKLEDPADVDYAARKLGDRGEEYVVQELLAGREINIDFFCDAQGALRSWVALERQAMGGSRAISRGEILFDTGLGPHVERLTAALRFWGANQLQAYQHESGRLAFTEINGRFSVSSAFVREAGVDYFAACVDLLQGRAPAIAERPRSLSMSSWEQPFFYERSPLREARGDT